MAIIVGKRFEAAGYSGFLVCVGCSYWISGVDSNFGC